MYRESKIANFSLTPTTVTMKLGYNVQSVTSYLLINFELYKAISARDIGHKTFGSDDLPHFRFSDVINFWFFGLDAIGFLSDLKFLEYS